MNKLLTLLFIFSLAFFPSNVFSQDKVENAGFLPGNIWYSKDPLLAGDKVEIHTIVFNSGNGELTGTVEFYDSEKLLGKVNISVASGGKFADVSIPWTVTEGYHKIFALIKNTKVKSGNSGLSVLLDNSKSDESEKFIASVIASNSATSTVGKYVSDKINIAKDYADKNLPAPVSDSVSSAQSFLEEVRKSGKEWSDNKGVELNESIKKLNEKEERAKSINKEAYTSALDRVEKPLKYLYVFFTSIISSVLGSKFFFYGILFAVLFFVIRFIKRIFFF